MFSSRADEKLMLVPYQPGLQLQRRILISLVVLVAAGCAVGAGWYAGLQQHKLGDTEKARLQQLVLDTQQQMNAQKQQITMLERGREIDSMAKQEIQATIIELENNLAQYKKDIAFYKNIMAPSGDDKGLKVQELDLWSGAEKQSYKYKLVLTQVGNNNSYIQGLVAVNLIGKQGDNREILPLRDVEGADDLGVKFRFRYFQNIEGELVLPEGFHPAQVQVVAQASGKKATKIERTFDWKVGE